MSFPAPRYGIPEHAKPVDNLAIERLCAADLVLLMRRAATLAQTMTAEEAEAHARRCDALAIEARAAAICFRKGRPDFNHIPTYLRSEDVAGIHD